jgi:hypothetical protein
MPLAISNGSTDPTFGAWYTYNPSFNNPDAHQTLGLSDVGFHWTPTGIPPGLKGATNGRPPHLAKNERDTRISCTRHHPARRVRLSLRKAA